METNLMIWVASVSTIFAFGLGGVIGWIYKDTVDRNTYKRQLDNLHPEFLDGNGSYVNEELLAVKFMDEDLLLDEDED
jgi:hypothetical protein|tara:strand:+ start:1157 stop:1390 length:234 start_codon:yes stop_codon:yes gene_type:complete